MKKNQLLFSLAVFMVPMVQLNAIERPGDPYVKDLESPSLHVLEKAEKALTAYRDSRSNIVGMTIDVNKQKGLIQTSWYDDHKGEVHIKVQIIVWGTHFHVDAWQKVGLVFKDIRKTEWSQWTERKIQENIEKLLTP